MSENEMIECADCCAALENDGEKRENGDGDRVCEDCAGGYVPCADCGEVVASDSEYRDADNNPVCESCGERYGVCGDCGAVIHEDDGAWIDGAEMQVCDSCLDARYCRCDDCGRYVSEDDSYGLGTGGRICHTCYERGDYTRCCECGDLYPASDLNYDEEGEEDYCDDCHRIRRQDDDRHIHQYGYKPPWRYHRTLREERRRELDPFYLGIELEVENASGGAHSNGDTAKAVREMVPAICKYDGSIHDGFEIVFHPMTYGYAVVEGRKQIEDCLQLLRQRRFSGHNYGGMHVHINHAAFSRLHLYKFHRLFKNARQLFAAISQRKPETLEQWASFANMPDLPNSNLDRYCALNYTRHTVEVRIFNSTLRADRFFKNLETVKAAIDYTKRSGLRQLDAEHFTEFVMSNRGEYRNLATFLVEKFVNVLSDVAVDVRVVRQVQKRITRRAG